MSRGQNGAGSGGQKLMKSPPRVAQLKNSPCPALASALKMQLAFGLNAMSGIHCRARKNLTAFVPSARSNAANKSWLRIRARLPHTHARGNKNTENADGSKHEKGRLNAVTPTT